MRIYISGPMTGVAELNRPAFDAAEKRLTAQGHFVINPHRLSAQFGTAKVLAESFDALYRLEDGLHHDIDADDYFETHDAAKLARVVVDAALAAALAPPPDLSAYVPTNRTIAGVALDAALPLAGGKVAAEAVVGYVVGYYAVVND